MCMPSHIELSDAVERRKYRCYRFWMRGSSKGSFRTLLVYVISYVQPDECHSFAFRACHFLDGLVVNASTLLSQVEKEASFRDSRILEGTKDPCPQMVQNIPWNPRFGLDHRCSLLTFFPWHESFEGVEATILRLFSIISLVLTSLSFAIEAIRLYGETQTMLSQEHVSFIFETDMMKNFDQTYLNFTGCSLIKLTAQTTNSQKKPSRPTISTSWEEHLKMLVNDSKGLDLPSFFFLTKTSTFHWLFASISWHRTVTGF